MVIGGVFAGSSPGISGPIAKAEVGRDGSRGHWDKGHKHRQLL